MTIAINIRMKRWETYEKPENALLPDDRCRRLSAGGEPGPKPATSVGLRNIILY